MEPNIDDHARAAACADTPRAASSCCMWSATAVRTASCTSCVSSRGGWWGVALARAAQPLCGSCGTITRAGTVLQLEHKEVGRATQRPSNQPVQWRRSTRSLPPAVLLLLQAMVVPGRIVAVVAHRPQCPRPTAAGRERARGRLEPPSRVARPTHSPSPDRGLPQAQRERRISVTEAVWP